MLFGMSISFLYITRVTSIEPKLSNSNQNSVEKNSFGFKKVYDSFGWDQLVCLYRVILFSSTVLVLINGSQRCSFSWKGIWDISFLLIYYNYRESLHLSIQDAVSAWLITIAQVGNSEFNFLTKPTFSRFLTFSIRIMHFFWMSGLRTTFPTL